jgi:hypothetical protein
MTKGRRAPIKQATRTRPSRRTAGKTLAADPAFERARTPLGAELRRLRARILASGERLLDREDIERITAEWRGDPA